MFNGPNCENSCLDFGCLPINSSGGCAPGGTNLSMSSFCGKGGGCFYAPLGTIKPDMCCYANCVASGQPEAPSVPFNTSSTNSLSATSSVVNTPTSTVKYCRKRKATLSRSSTSNAENSNLIKRADSNIFERIKEQLEQMDKSLQWLQIGR